MTRSRSGETAGQEKETHGAQEISASHHPPPAIPQVTFFFRAHKATATMMMTVVVKNDTSGDVPRCPAGPIADRRRSPFATRSVRNIRGRATGAHAARVCQEGRSKADETRQ